MVGPEPLALSSKGSLTVDRPGLRLRTRTGGGCRDVHLAFDSPAECACEANHAINDLFVRASATP